MKRNLVFVFVIAMFLSVFTGVKAENELLYETFNSCSIGTIPSGGTTPKVPRPTRTTNGVFNPDLVFLPMMGITFLSIRFLPTREIPIV